MTLKLRKLLPVALFILAACSASPPVSLQAQPQWATPSGAHSPEDDFSVSGQTTQEIALGSSRSVVIRCYCPNHTLRQDPKAKTIRLNIRGTHGSVGFHGAQEKPTSLKDELLRFVLHRNGKRLTLESTEYTYIHHSLILDELEIVAPQKLQISVETIPRERLEGRHTLAVPVRPNHSVERTPEKRRRSR